MFNGLFCFFLFSYFFSCPRHLPCIYIYILTYIQNIYYMIFDVNVFYTILKILTILCKNTTQKKFVRTNFLNEQTKRIFLVFFLNMMMKITMMMMMMMGWCTYNLMKWWCYGWFTETVCLRKRWINWMCDYEISGNAVVPTWDHFV